MNHILFKKSSLFDHDWENIWSEDDQVMNMIHAMINQIPKKELYKMFGLTKNADKDPKGKSIKGFSKLSIELKIETDNPTPNQTS